MTKRSIMARIKVLLIEDNRLLRDGTTAMLNEQRDIRAVSASGNSGAMAKAVRFKPDVVLLDLGLKSRDSLKVLGALKKRFPHTEVIVMDLIPAHTEVVAYVEAGVSGFMPKDATLDELLHTIRAVVKGVRMLPPTMADSLFSQIVESAIQSGTVTRVMAAVKLTKREQHVIRLLAEGQSVTQIAATLKVAGFTVKNHVRNILDKLALHARLELASFAHAGDST